VTAPPKPPTHDAILALLAEMRAGSPDAEARLLALVYPSLHRLASHYMRHERADHTLQTTALVHEAYLRLVDVDKAQHWSSRGHFFAAAAEAMRRILVESARRKSRAKHGGGRRRVALDDALANPSERADDLLALDEALAALARDDPAKAELVKLRYFAGLTLEEAAACRGISLATAKRHWAVARAWLYDALSSDDPLNISPNS
jgi:RNA polymerase sigma factor (TIGR02999 family)